MGLRVERIPTLSDNYTYLIVCEATGEAAVVDAPEDGPVVRRVADTGARVTKILSTHHHPDHSMANPKLAERYGAPVFGHASDAGRLPGLTDGLEEGDTLFAAGCGRLFEGNPEMMYEALQGKLGRLPGDFRVYCGHEYTESNLRFAVHAEPDNAAAQEKLERVRALRAHAAADWHDATPAEMTIPSTLAEEHATNPFMRAKDAADLGRLRAMKDSF